MIYSFNPFKKPMSRLSKYETRALPGAYIYEVVLGVGVDRSEIRHLYVVIRILGGFSS